MARAGNYRHWITIKKSVTTQDNYGQPIKGWTARHANVQARVMDVGGGEIIRGQQIEAHITTVVETRFLAGVKATDSIAYGTRTLNIDKVLNPDGIERVHFYHCKEQD